MSGGGEKINIKQRKHVLKNKGNTVKLQTKVKQKQKMKNNKNNGINQLTENLF